RQKPFPGRLAVNLDEPGYQPRFFYGGHACTLRLGQYLPVMGVLQQLFLYFFPHLFHHPYGLYDRDLLKALHQNLMATGEKRTFSYVMTLSNHPPYNVPKEFDNQDVKLPKSLTDRLIDPKEQFYKRINGFRFADAS